MSEAMTSQTTALVGPPGLARARLVKRAQVREETVLEIIRLMKGTVMKSVLAHLGVAVLLVAPIPAIAADSMTSPSGEVRIVGGDMEMKSVSVGGSVLPLDDFRADLLDKVGNLILVAIYSGGTACPATYAWLDTTPGNIGLSERFGTCSDLYEMSHDAETVTVTMPSFDASEGRVAFVFDGREVSRRVLGLESSEVARKGVGNIDVWIGESPYEYLTARENEATLIRALGWESLDELRNTMVIGSQKMFVEGGWIVGEGCRPHMCNTDFAAIALHRETGQLIAAIKRDGARPQLLGTPPDALPNTIRAVMVAN